MKKNNKTLHLPLFAKYYIMIEEGVKPEEYRDLTPYWFKRLLELNNEEEYLKKIDENVASFYCRKENYNKLVHMIQSSLFKYKDYDFVDFSYGYTTRRMKYKITGMRIGLGKPCWGAPEDRPVFIIGIGDRVNDERAG